MVKLQENGTWCYPWGANRRGPYGGTPADPMHTILAGLLKYIILWLLGLIRFVKGGKQGLNELDRRFRSIVPLGTDKRMRLKKFSGASFILGSSVTKEKLNGCGGFMTSSEWFPMLIFLLVVIMDESLHNSYNILEQKYHLQFIDAANLAINLWLWIKSGKFRVGSLPDLHNLTQRWVVAGSVCRYL